jgi:hypothetical protein
LRVRRGKARIRRALTNEPASPRDEIPASACRLSNPLGMGARGRAFQRSRGIDAAGGRSSSSPPATVWRHTPDGERLVRQEPCAVGSQTTRPDRFSRPAARNQRAIGEGGRGGGLAPHKTGCSLRATDGPFPDLRLRLRRSCFSSWSRNRRTRPLGIPASSSRETDAPSPVRRASFRLATHLSRQGEEAGGHSQMPRPPAFRLLDLVGLHPNLHRERRERFRLRGKLESLLPRARSRPVATVPESRS